MAPAGRSVSKLCLFACFLPLPACLGLPRLQVSLMGATLSIGRPSGYVDPGKAAAAATVAAEALAKFQVRPRETIETICGSPLSLLFPLPALQQEQ